MLNANLQERLEFLQTVYKKDKVVTISDFLDLNCAEKIYNFLNKEMSLNWWHASFNPPRLNFQLIPENENEIELAKVKANQSFKNGEFSFSFKRTLGDHYEFCTCEECKFRLFLQSKSVIDFLCNLTNSSFSKANTIFASLYESGDFLSIHTDNDNGKIGFVLNLTKNWFPQYGGNLHFLDQGCQEVLKTIVPKFNNLIIFDLETYNGVPHFVSHIAPRVKEKRLAFGGWYS